MLSSESGGVQLSLKKPEFTSPILMLLLLQTTTIAFTLYKPWFYRHGAQIGTPWQPPEAEHYPSSICLFWGLYLPDFGCCCASSQFSHPSQKPVLIKSTFGSWTVHQGGRVPCLKGSTVLRESNCTFPGLNLGPGTLFCLDSEPEKSLIASESIFANLGPRARLDVERDRKQELIHAVVFVFTILLLPQIWCC